MRDESYADPSSTASVIMYPCKSYSKRYISKEKVICARTPLETTFPNDDKYLVQGGYVLLNLGNS